MAFRSSLITPSGKCSGSAHACSACETAPCADPGISVGGGGPGQTDKKDLTTFFFSFLFFFFFFFFFLVLSLFYRSQMANFKEIYHFSRFKRGSNIFQGGPTFSRGVHLLIPYRNPYNL